LFFSSLFALLTVENVELSFLQYLKLFLYLLIQKGSSNDGNILLCLRH
jgi:hypothetical protein